MNKRDRERLARLQGALNKIPMPHDGVSTATASIRSLAKYSAEMRQVMPLASRIITAIACEQDEGYHEWGDPPEDLLTELEALVQRGLEAP